LFGEARQQGVDLALTRRVQRLGEVGDVELDHPVDRTAQQRRSRLVIEGRGAVGKSRVSVDAKMGHPARSARSE